ncbi:unnamed protein product [Rotaria sp. Silwood2]|nr:unnamed protein product [Rotaria sp. Silwood2]CAF2496168.1 unnamed protein product [Rotaria sp. Silwood2]CAF2726115.1 unnamed protein product [Rotaria sp. Silwood2]CAF3064238.1 unnamed protein product [Rotaria sp. Silwood2]CAF4093261.1 unnamed protein product [Rotaria sp. Silwood2]
MDIGEMNDQNKLKTTLRPQELLLTFEDLLTLIQEAIKSPRLDFRDPMLSNDDYLAWTDWNIAQFDILFDMLSPFLRSSCNRSLFNYAGDSETRRKRVADTFDSVQILLVRNFVPLNLGVSHLTRDEALIHNTSFTKEFWDNRVTIIWDALLDDINRGLISARSNWKNLDEQDIEFPEMNFNNLPSLFFGIYQIKQSKTYSEKHLRRQRKFCYTSSS